MQQSLFSVETRKTYTVTELNARIRAMFDKDFGDIFVSGEISGAKLAPSGHDSFTLKDGDSQVKCACFRMSARSLRFKPADGVAVIARGRLDVYDARGEYQLIVEHLEPQGFGALQFAFEQLKKKLAAEGLFDNQRKRPLPKYPRRIGLVTSATGAVIQDMLNILCRRFPGLHVRLYPAQVQGEGSVEQVVRGLRWFSESNWAEVVIVARGGGSLEDLWTFNEGAVARAIATSAIPVVSAIGHETDFTIADFVADLRAPTPSAAAELIVADVSDVLRRIGELSACLDRNLRNLITHSRTRLRFLSEKSLARDLMQRVHDAQQQIDLARESLTRVARQSLADNRARVASHAQTVQAHSPTRELIARLNSVEQLRRRLVTLPSRVADNARQRFARLEAMARLLGPEATLRRGYSITLDETGNIVRTTEAVCADQTVTTRVVDGTFKSKVLP